MDQEPKQDPQGQEQEPNLSQQEEDQEKFQRLVDELFNDYDPGSTLEESAVIRIASALWLRRDHREFNSDTRRLDQEISGALTHLSKSKAIRRDQELRSQATGIMSNIHRKTPRWGLVRRPVGPQTRAHLRCSRETLQPLAPPTGGHGFGNDLSPADSEEAKEGRRDRHDALYCKSIEAGLTPDEQIEFEALDALDTRWKPARVEDHHLYESILAWGKVADEEEIARPTRRVSHE